VYRTQTQLGTRKAHIEGACYITTEVLYKRHRKKGVLDGCKIKLSTVINHSSCLRVKGTTVVRAHCMVFCPGNVCARSSNIMADRRFRDSNDL